MIFNYFFITFFLITTCVSQSTYAKSNQVESTYVHSEILSKLSYHPTKKAPAEVIALADAQLNAEISSTVNKVHILVGDSVKHGDVLVTLNCDDNNYQLKLLDASFDEVNASLKLQQYLLERSKKLYQTKNISETELRSDKAKVKVLDAKLNSISVQKLIAQKNINRCLVKAPFDGVIIKRFISEGETITTGQKLLYLTDPNQVEVLVQLPIGLVNRSIDEGLFKYRESFYKVKLRAVVPVIETHSRHQQYRFTLLSKTKPPLGAFGEVEVQIPENYLTPDLLVKRQGKNGIFILNKKTSTVHFYPIKNANMGRPFAIKSDENLIGETQIITQGLENLIDNMHVKVLTK